MERHRRVIEGARKLMTIRNNEINQNANEIINRYFVSEGEGKKNVLEYQIATEKKIFFLLRNPFKRQIFTPSLHNSSSILN